MAESVKCRVEGNQALTADVFRMRLAGDTRGITRPGQFVQVALPGLYLRRPISVCDWQPGEQGWLELVVKKVGRGTLAMSQLQPGAELYLLVGLGNGFAIGEAKTIESTETAETAIESAGTATESAETAETAIEKAVQGPPLLVGGGVGTPPLYGLCKRLLACGLRPEVALGFTTAAEAFLVDEFEALGVSVTLCTLDGSAGIRGFVTQGMEALEGRYGSVFACGPEPMLRAVHCLCQGLGLPGQYSFEERMACGFGVCMGCSCQTKYGSKRICKDGPVLRGEEIVW